MALRGWRLFGVAGTIFAYVVGILLLSFVSVQNPQQRRPRARLYSETDPFQNRVLGLLSKRQPLQWCRELKYLHKNKIKLPVTTQPKLIQTFPGHYIKTKSNNDAVSVKWNEFDLNNKIENQIEYESRNDLKSSDLSKSQYGLTALASFPGSGNTWLRYLLQQSTGIYTGSVYKDYGLLKSGFPAENICNSSVLIVKTHEWGVKAWTPFVKAILLVRDPEKAILAEFNRQSGGHVGFASPDRYKRTKGRYWQQFVTNKLWAWEQMNLAWVRNFTGEVKVVFYDDLTDHVEERLREILNFINYPINEELLNCALTRREGIYRRKKRLMSFDPYTAAMHRSLNIKRDEVYSALGRTPNFT